MDTTEDTTRSHIPWFTRLTSQGHVTHDMLTADYGGSGTEYNPYLVTFLDDDPVNPLNFPAWRRWLLCVVAAFVTFTVAFNSSAYVSAVEGLSREFDCSPSTATLGVGVFLIGFVLGPFVWAPGSEIFGRQHTLLLATAVQVVSNLALCFSPNLTTVFLLRFFSGAFGAAPLTGAAAVIADTFAPRERGLAITVYALVPLLAPVVGPMVGEYVVGILGWRWLMALMAIISVASLIAAALLLPETYAPVILRKRALNMSKVTSRHYVSSLDYKESFDKSRLSTSWSTTLLRPFMLVRHEPLLVILALNQAVVFGTLYLTLTAFPIAYTKLRGWPQEQAGIAFIGVLLGVLLAAIFQIWDSTQYAKLVIKLGPQAALPEARLPACCGGGICIVVGLFWYAFTAGPAFHWVINATAGVPFGFGIILVTLGTTNYLIDCYTIYAASVVAVCIITRALVGAAFPLMVRSLLAKFGLFWTLAIPGFLCLAFVPVPFVLYRYGPALRQRGKFGKDAQQTKYVARQMDPERRRLLDP